MGVNILQGCRFLACSKLICTMCSACLLFVRIGISSTKRRNCTIRFEFLLLFRIDVSIRRSLINTACFLERLKLVSIQVTVHWLSVICIPEHRKSKLRIVSTRVATHVDFYNSARSGSRSLLSSHRFEFSVQEGKVKKRLWLSDHECLACSWAYSDVGLLWDLESAIQEEKAAQHVR